VQSLAGKLVEGKIDSIEIWVRRRLTHLQFLRWSSTLIDETKPKSPASFGKRCAVAWASG
jgi:hypothetical protein